MSATREDQSSPSAKVTPARRSKSPRSASPSPRSGGAKSLERVFDALNTPTGGRTVRREIEDLALSRKPSPLKKKQVLDLWDSYRKKLWDETCEDCNVDPAAAAATESKLAARLAPQRAEDFPRFQNQPGGLELVSTHRGVVANSAPPNLAGQGAFGAPSASSASAGTTGLPDILPMDTVLRVRQILCQLNNEDIAQMKPGYFQELVTLGHLIIRRSQEYYS